MPREQQPLRPILVDYHCDSCGNGHYRPTGMVLSSHPPQYPHRCDSCDEARTFHTEYPALRYAPEGELLDLDNFLEAA